MIQDDFAFVDSGGTGEYRRLEKARRLSQDKKLLMRQIAYLIALLREKNCASFARKYNTPAYKTNKYDEKLERDYAKYSKQTKQKT